MLVETPESQAAHHQPAVPGSESGADRFLAAIDWLQAVAPRTLARLAHAAVLHRIPAGSLIFEQAETPAFAQFLLEGSVELVRPVDLLLPAAVLNRRPYLLRARVFEDARLLMVRADGFRQAVAAGHDLCLAILACQAAQFRRMVKQAKNLRLRPAEDRVGCYLLRLAEQTDPGQPIRLPKEKRLIASELGMTQETFSRSLALVIQHGLRVEGDLVVVEDFAAARTRFPLDPLIDDPEHLAPLTTRRKLLWKALPTTPARWNASGPEPA
jgi:CRP/FNR family transcriptional regulator, transcriptional activator FtrB